MLKSRNQAASSNSLRTCFVRAPITTVLASNFEACQPSSAVPEHRKRSEFKSKLPFFGRQKRGSPNSLPSFHAPANLPELFARLTTTLQEPDRGERRCDLPRNATRPSPFSACSSASDQYSETLETKPSCDINDTSSLDSGSTPNSKRLRASNASQVSTKEGEVVTSEKLEPGAVTLSDAVVTVDACMVVREYPLCPSLLDSVVRERTLQRSYGQHFKSRMKTCTPSSTTTTTTTMRPNVAPRWSPHRVASYLRPTPVNVDARGDGRPRFLTSRCFSYCSFRVSRCGVVKQTMGA
ncbi:hypothetical protein MRX96_050915 [Rhipicephalus microplus]